MKQRKELKQHMKMMLIIAALTVLILIVNIWHGMNRGLTFKECFMTGQQIQDSWVLDSDSMNKANPYLD